MKRLLNTNIDKMGFRALLHMLMVRRWWATLIVLLTFLAIILGIGIAIHNKTEIGQDWKDFLFLLLGAFIGNYGKIIDYWFSDAEKDKIFAQKMDEEDGLVLSHIKDENIKDENIEKDNIIVQEPQKDIPIEEEVIEEEVIEEKPKEEEKV